VNSSPLPTGRVHEIARPAPCARGILRTLGLDPVTVNFDLDRCMPLRVRVTDKATGKPVRGRVSYYARPENPHLKDYPRIGQPGFRLRVTDDVDEDGARTVHAIPGLGFLCIVADNADRYVGFELKDWDGFLLRAVPGGLHPSHFHAVVPIDVSEKDAKSTTIAIALEPGRTRAGTVVGPDGQPLAGVLVAGVTPIVHSRKRLPDATFTAFGLNPRKSRNIVFFHPEKKLGKVQAVRGDEAGPLTVHLEPLGGVTGRILDAKGRPWAELRVQASITRLIVAYKDLPWELMENLGPTMEVITTTDREGKFRIDGLLPGLRYNLAFSVGEIQPGTTIPAHVEDVTVEAGKSKDLADVQSKLVPENEAKAKP
jgi:hypothetical protein